MKIEFDTIEELQSLIEYLGSLKESDKKTAKTRSEINHQNYLNRKSKQSEQSEMQSESDREEREEKEAGSSPLSPSSPSSSPSDSPNNIPITPYNPPLPEEKGEREESVSAKAKPVKNHHGDYQHVLLTADEFFKLQEKFGWNGCHDWIRRLDEYLENNRKKHYDSHYLTILNWARKDENKPQPQQKKTYSFAEVGQMMRNGEL